jgi:hypothetical protein
MSVNHSPQHRVITTVVAIGVAFSTLAWSGDNKLNHPSRTGIDTIPSRVHADKKVLKHRRGAEEGRVARELDLRMDMEEEPLPELPETDLLSDLDISVDLEALKGLNARIEADILRDMDAWNNLDALKGLDILERSGLQEEQDALDQLKDMGIEEEDLQELKDLNIDEEIWNELKDLKEEMDDVRNEIEEDRAKGVDEYRVQEEAERVMDAVRAEIPRVRREVERALQDYRDSEGRQWQ